MKLTAWNARRSGGRITITGKAENGAEAKIPNVDTIYPRGGQLVAIDKNGMTHELATA